jgi:uracil-DNA glycosylase family 4
VKSRLKIFPCAAQRVEARLREMTDSYAQLLDATIRHLERLRAAGSRFIELSPEALRALSRLPRVTPAARLTARPQTPSPAPVAAKPPADARPAQNSELLPPSESKIVEAQRPPPSAPLNAQAKAAAFAELRQRALACVKCGHLAASRKNVVFGVGSINADLMFVGEAPGADEDVQGEPFVGRAGQLLTKIIETMGLKRDSVYIANILKCRPDTPGQTAGNRKPTPEEMQTCIPFLHEQIDLIRPKVLVALGGTAIEGLLGKMPGIMKLRGQWQTYRGIPLMPTYHPAYVLRNQALSEKRKVWEDMLQVMGRLELPVSEKQQGFFLKG